MGASDRFWKSIQGFAYQTESWKEENENKNINFLTISIKFVSFIIDWVCYEVEESEQKIVLKEFISKTCFSNTYTAF